MPGDDLCCQLTFIGCAVREHGSTSDVSNGIDIGNTGLLLLIDHDKPTIQFNPRGASCSIWHTSDSDQHFVRGNFDQLITLLDTHDNAIFCALPVLGWHR